jgi:hypothetical protein
MEEAKDRRYFGITDKGRIEVIHKKGFDDSGEHVTHQYEVRQGAHTMAVSNNEASVVALAVALFDGGDAPIGDPLGKVATPDYLKAKKAQSFKAEAFTR